MLSRLVLVTDEVLANGQAGHVKRDYSKSRCGQCVDARTCWLRQRCSYQAIEISTE